LWEVQLIGGLEHGFYDFPCSWEWNNHPNWRSPFFRGVGIPPTRYDIGIYMDILIYWWNIPIYSWVYYSILDVYWSHKCFFFPGRVRMFVTENWFFCIRNGDFTWFTIWLFNIAMGKGPFIDDFPIKTSTYKRFSMAMLNKQMVIHDSPWEFPFLTQD
jgi:hypothetical protein